MDDRMRGDVVDDGIRLKASVVHLLTSRMHSTTPSARTKQPATNNNIRHRPHHIKPLRRTRT